jgi:competence protein ComEA
MTPGRDAFLQLVGVLLASGLLRAGCSPRIPPEDALPGRAVDPSALVDSAQLLAEEAERRSRPLEAGERLDPNEASEAELDRLPGVGPGLARAIVAARDTLPFASVDDLSRVRGIGASTLDKLRPGLTVRPSRARVAPGSPVRTVLPSPGSPSPSRASPPSGAGRLELNGASAAELESLPGVGPVLAQRIVEERSRRGGFGSVDDLIAVKGIGSAVLERLRGRVRVGPGP